MKNKGGGAPPGCYCILLYLTFCNYPPPHKNICVLSYTHERNWLLFSNGFLLRFSICEWRASSSPPAGGRRTRMSCCGGRCLLRCRWEHAVSVAARWLSLLVAGIAGVADIEVIGAVLCGYWGCWYGGGIGELRVVLKSHTDGGGLWGSQREVVAKRRAPRCDGPLSLLLSLPLLLPPMFRGVYVDGHRHYFDDKLHRKCRPISSSSRRHHGCY